jgi:hypothetical protein
MEMNTLHHFSDGLYAKQIELPIGFFATQHKHTYDHLSILAKGKVRILFDNDVVEEYTAPACINIIKDVNHSVYAIEDSVWFCVHATEETNLDEIDNVLIKKEGE